MKKSLAIKRYAIVPILLSAALPFIQQAGFTQVAPAVDGTNTSVSQVNNTFNINGGTQAGTNLFHSFQQFGLNQGQIANFLSNSAIANILGRVTGGNASVINGQIQVTGSNANLYLMNPAGIVFGANASLNVPASFTATTANGIGVGNTWFNASGNNNYAALSGTPQQFAFTTLQPGVIINAGNLAVGQGQSITLLGGTVINTGTLTAPGGTVTIAAVPGEKLVRINQAGSLLSLDLPTETRTVLNPATITPVSLPALLTGGNLASATGLTVENGVTRLTGSGVAIPTGAGVAIVSNHINVSGETGGAVNVLGEKVGVVRATINASGTNGGGTVLLGGDYKGQGTVPNAQQTYVSRDSVINVDALQTGNGGQAIVWADQNTRFYGNISARGGARSGDGGFVEVSGKQSLAFDGNVDLQAPNGVVGQLLLDPNRVVISFTGTNDDIAELADGEIFATDSGDTLFISVDRIRDLLDLSDVRIAATTEIQVQQSINFTDFSSSNGLYLTAPQIQISGDIDLDGTGTIAITASNNLTVENAILSTGGDVNLNAPSGSLLLENSRVQAGGNLTAQAQTTLTVDESQLQANQTLTLQTPNTLTVRSSRLESGQDLRLIAANASGQVRVEDAAIPEQETVLRAGNDLTLQGNQAITINALNNPLSILQSGRTLSLISDNPIVGNGRFSSGGNLSVLTTSGAAGTLLYTPISSPGIISSGGDVSFGSYTGAALKIEARGNIIASGDITINSANTTLSGTDPDIPILVAGPALILRAGVTQLQNAPQTSQTLAGTEFTSSTNPTSSASISVRNINTEPGGEGGAIILSAPGDIQAGNLNTRGDRSAGFPSFVIVPGSISLRSDGNITVQTIDTSGNDAGDVTINAGGTFRAVGSFLAADFVDGSTNANNVSGRAVLGANLLTSIRATGISEGGARVQIRQAGTAFQVGPNFTLDNAGEVIYREFTDIGGAVVLGERVTPALNPDGSIDLNRFVRADGTVITRFTVIAVSAPLNITDPTVSFTAGAITSNQTNAGLVVSIRDRPFNNDLAVGGRISITFGPRIIGGGNTGGGTANGNTGSNSGTSNNPVSGASSTIISVDDSQIVQRQINNQTLNSVCDPSTTIASATIPETRSPNATSNPCTTTNDNTQILKILGEDGK
jgi:filamentous hemagglutinin family protein